MHGRPRPPKGFQSSAEQREKIQKRTDLLRAATTGVLTRVKDRDYDPETLNMSAKLLALNPEIYTAWNYRKDALAQYFALETTNDESKQQHLKQEAALTEQALVANAKSYASWHHRRWIVNQGGSSSEAEFRFVESHLEKDSRNFHAWNYRRFLVSVYNRSPEREFQFSQMKIEQNFSNYSAWNHRIHCLEALHQQVKTVSFNDVLSEDPAALPTPQGARIPRDSLKAELEIVQSAFVTDPDDSSAWLYYRWIIAHLFTLSQSDKDAMHVVEAQMHFFKEELLPMDPNSKWILLSYSMLLHTYHSHSHTDRTVTPELSDVYSKLIEVDPMRKGFYEDLRAGNVSILMNSI